MTEKRMDADGLREVKRVSLTKVVVARGAGTDRDVVRLVTMLFDDEGTCVAEYDPAWPTPHFGDPRKAWLQPAPPRSSPSRIDCSGTAFIVSGEYYQAELREDGTLVFHPNGCSHPRPSVQDENLCVCRLHFPAGPAEAGVIDSHGIAHRSRGCAFYDRPRKGWL